MSIVIVGGHDRMVGQYKKICKSYKCKCKVFTQMEADFGKKDRMSGSSGTFYKYRIPQDGKMRTGRGWRFYRYCALPYQQWKCTQRYSRSTLLINTFLVYIA